MEQLSLSIIARSHGGDCLLGVRIIFPAFLVLSDLVGNGNMSGKGHDVAHAILDAGDVLFIYTYGSYIEALPL